MLKGSEKRKSRKTRFSLCCFFILFWVLVSALSLVSIRLYGLYLEQKLAACNTEIEKIGDLYALLEQEQAALLSPSRIYNLAKANLSMVTASQVETIKLLSDSYVPSAPPEAPINVARTPGLLGRIFSGIASAKE